MVRLIYGDHTSMIHLHREGAIREASAAGADILIDPEEEDVRSLFQGFYPPGRTLVVWENNIPDKWDSAWKDSPVVDFLVITPSLKKYAWLNLVKKRDEMLAPKPWEEEASAVLFLKEMSQANGLVISEPLRRAIVKAVGTDIGILRFELWKLLMVCEKEVTSDQVKSTIAPLASPDGDALIQHIIRNDVARVITTMDRIWDTSGSDPTMKITLQYLQPTFLKWYYALRAGDVASASAALSVNRWVMENKIWPIATLVGEAKCSKLIKAVAAAHAAVAKGSRHAWAILKIGILDSMGHQ